MITQLFPIAVAGIFFLTGELDPICSICFLGSAHSRTKKDAVESYISLTTLHKLAAVAPMVDKAGMAEFIVECVNDINKEFGVDCTGYLNAYTLSIVPAEGGTACP